MTAKEMALDAELAETQRQLEQAQREVADLRRQLAEAQGEAQRTLAASEVGHPTYLSMRQIADFAPLS